VRTGPEKALIRVVRAEISGITAPKPIVSHSTVRREVYLYDFPSARKLLCVQFEYGLKTALAPNRGVSWLLRPSTLWTLRVDGAAPYDHVKNVGDGK